MDKIIDGLYLGDIQGASNLFMLKRMVTSTLIVIYLSLGYYSYFTSSSWLLTLLSWCNTFFIYINMTYSNLSTKS